MKHKSITHIWQFCRSLKSAPILKSNKIISFNSSKMDKEAHQEEEVSLLMNITFPPHRFYCKIKFKYFSNHNTVFFCSEGCYQESIKLFGKWTDSYHKRCQATGNTSLVRCGNWGFPRPIWTRKLLRILLQPFLMVGQWIQKVLIPQQF